MTVAAELNVTIVASRAGESASATGIGKSAADMELRIANMSVPSIAISPSCPRASRFSVRRPTSDFGLEPNIVKAIRAARVAGYVIVMT